MIMEEKEEQQDLFDEMENENVGNNQEFGEKMDEETKEEKQDLFEESVHDEKKENTSTDGPVMPIQANLEADLFGEDDGTAKVDIQVEESTVKKLVTEILQVSNIDEISMKQIREELTTKHSIDCQKHKKLIRDTVDSYLADHPAEDDNQEITDALGERNTVQAGNKRKSGICLLPFTSLLCSQFLSSFCKTSLFISCIIRVYGN
jgi:hypothetical protein